MRTGRMCLSMVVCVLSLALARWRNSGSWERTRTATMSHCRYRVWGISLLLLCGLVWVQPAAAQVAFVEALPTPLTFPHGGGPTGGIAQGDFNHDGIPDLAVPQTNGGNCFLSIMLGHGDGTFGAPTNIPLGDCGVGILARDMDGDGTLDMVMASPGYHSVFFFKGRGDGTFADPIPTPLTAAPVQVQAADLNGDGRLDVVTINPSDNSVTVLLGNGDGTFQVSGTSRVTANPQDLALADVDGGHGPDIIVGTYDGSSIDVLLNDGTGHFPATAQSFNVRGNVEGISVGDFDGDGKLDVVAAIAGGPQFMSMVLIKGNGDGTFTPPPDSAFIRLWTDFPARRHSENVTHDFNGDGKPDVLWTANSNHLILGLGNGQGGFSTITTYVASPGSGVSGNVRPDGSATGSYVVADFNGDGVLDVAVASGASNDRSGGVSILLGTTPGNFAAARTYLTAIGNPAFPPADRGAVLGDFNGDGKLDVAVLNGNGDPNVEVFPGNGDGTLGGPIRSVSGAGGGRVLKAADFNGDGKLDLIWQAGSRTVVAFGNGDGTFGIGAVLVPQPGMDASNFALGDFNHDGQPDIAVWGINGCIAAYCSAHIEVWTNNGGTFTRTAGSPEMDVGPMLLFDDFITVGDFDGDGKQDLVVRVRAAGYIFTTLFFKGKGDGTFYPPTSVDTGADVGFRDAIAADVNGDGRLDWIQTGGNGVFIQLGNGDGTFQAARYFDVGGGGAAPLTPSLADINGDGIPDLVVGNGACCQGAGVAVYLGNGDGTFQAPSIFAVGSSHQLATVVGDLNGDGKPDIVAAHGGSGTGVTVLLSAPTLTLTVTKSGVGSGTVTSTPAGIDCGATCTASFASGTAVTLTATPAAGSIFAGWSGDPDCIDGSVAMVAGRTCTATFNIRPTLSVTKFGTGSGAVTSSPAGIDCGSTCTASFASGTAVTLTATPASDSTFARWSGDCNSSGQVTMNANKSCTATFTLSTLTVTTLGTRSGGDTGSVSLKIYGNGFQPGATVKLVRAGQPDIVGNPVTVGAGGQSITTTFDLTGKARGTWDVVVTNPDGTSTTLPGGFTIEAGGAPQVWVDIIGPSALRNGLPGTFYIFYGNRGDIDAPETLIRVSVPKNASFELLFTEQSNPGLQLDSSFKTDEEQIIPIYVPKIGATSQAALGLRLRMPPDTPAHSIVQLNAWWATGVFSDVVVAPDPSVTITPGLVSATQNSFEMTLHVAGSDITGDIDATWTETDATVEKEFTAETIETSDVLTLRYEATVAVPISGTASVAHGPLTLSYKPTQATPPGWKLINGVYNIQARGDFKNLKKALKSLAQIPIVSDATVVAQQRVWLTECLYKHGYLYDKDDKVAGTTNEYLHLKNYANAGVFIAGMNVSTYWLGTPIKMFTGHLDAFYAVVTPLWEEELYKIYQFGRGDDPQSPYKDGIWANFKMKTDLSRDAFFRALLEQVVKLCASDPSDPPYIIAQRVSALAEAVKVSIVTSTDPNDKAGSSGAGEVHYLSGQEPLRYAIYFENKATATAPAQTVVITDQLDLTKMDLSTFSLGPIAFGNQLITPPPGLTQYTTDVDLRPANNLIVRINAGLDANTGLLTWRFTSIDPATGQPTTDPLAGFLPPNVKPPEGMGSVLFTVMPKQGLPTNTQIKNQAMIVFDVNAPIPTPTWLNTLDNTTPTSQVSALPATEFTASFTVQWAGTDVGSGIQDFTVFVSDNGGSYAPFVTHTTDTAATFTGQAGHTYRFYSVARDQTGNVERKTLAAEATTQVVVDTIPPTTLAAASPPPNAKGWNNTAVTVTLSATDNPGGSGVKQIKVSLTGASSGTQTVSGSSATVAIANEGVTTLTYFATDNAGNQEAPKTLTVQIDKTPPVITGSRAPAPNAFGWNNTNVTVSFSCADVGAVQSGIATNTVAGQTLSAEGAGQAVTNTGNCVDKAGNAATPVTVSNINIDKTPPVITGSASPASLWPPNGKMVPVTISGTMVDALSGVNAGTTTYAVTDEYGKVQPSGSITLGAKGSYTFTIQLEASRNGDDLDGRLYTISVSAQDYAGNRGSASIGVTVPHDQGK